MCYAMILYFIAESACVSLLMRKRDIDLYRRCCEMEISKTGINQTFRDMINMKQWKAELLANPQVKAIPIMTHPGIEMCDKSVLSAVTDGEVHFEAIRCLNERYPSAAVTAIMDLTVEAEAFGAEIIFPEDEVPSVIGRLVCDFESVKALKVPPMTSGRVPQYLKANRLTAEAIKDKPVLGGCIGPFSLAGRLFDMSELMIAVYTEPETIELLLEKCTEFISNYCKAIKDTGIAGVVIAEPAAGLISNEDCLTFSSIYLKKIIDAVQDDDFMIVLHNCGNTGHCTEAMVFTGAEGYHFGNAMDMSLALTQVPSDKLVMGNLDPVGLFKQSSAEQITQATNKLLAIASEYNNFIISSGCDIPPHIPFENIDAFYDAIKKFNGTL